MAFCVHNLVYNDTSSFLLIKPFLLWFPTNVSLSTSYKIVTSSDL
jgi:hypothetical protein